MRLVYNILYPLFFVLSAPYYLWKMWRRGNWRSGFGQRFGRYEPGIRTTAALKPVLWFHAVSVGEVGVCARLIEELEPLLPGWQVLATTTTSTGMEELRRKLPEHVLKVFYPTDFPWVVRWAMDTFQPQAIVLVESELWPNFLWQAVERQVPLFLVNARVSERSFRGYQRFGRVFRPIFGQFHAAGCQNAEDAARLRELGFRADAVQTLGNLKFDAALPGDRRGLDVGALLRQIGVAQDAIVLVAGSTHAGEEAILGSMLLRLRQKCPKLFLVLVPRHFERTREVCADLDKCGVKFLLRDRIQPDTQLPASQLECLLVNTTGELKFFYEHADVVFVGKSLTAKGGQNPIEPAALGKATVFGPNMQNFKPVVQSFLAGRGVVQVRDAAELEQVLGELLADEPRRRELGQNALRVVQENSGAIERTAKMLAAHLQREIRNPKSEIRNKPQ